MISIRTFACAAVVAGLMSLAEVKAAEPFDNTIFEQPAASTPSNNDQAIQPVSFTPVSNYNSFCQSQGCDSVGGCCQNGGCHSGCGCGCNDGLFRSDHCFDGFIEPVTNPVFFEDPRSRTRLRAVFINQMIPEDSILAGGDFQVYAAQLSVALNDRLAFIANKDGYITLQADALDDRGGWADLATGFKYVIVRDPQEQFLFTGGILYEWSNGSSDVFQGNGDGMWTFFLTTGKEIAEDTHFVGTFGWHLPNNGNQESQSLYYSLHLDREIADGLYALTELNGIQYTRSGNRLPGVNQEGGDLINLGAGDVAGNSVVTMAFGGAYKFSESLILSGAWEFPLTSREDLLDSRTTVTLSLIY